MHSQVTIAAALFVIAGCSSAPKRPPEPSKFAEVYTIELRDASNPVLLAATGAKRVREYIELGLTHRGYTVCHDCKSDVVATVTVHTYRTRQDSKRDWVGWGNLNYMEVGESDWTLGIVRNGETIYQKRTKQRKAMPIDQLAGQQVQDVLRGIPARK